MDPMTERISTLELRQRPGDILNRQPARCRRWSPVGHRRRRQASARPSGVRGIRIGAPRGAGDGRGGV